MKDETQQLNTWSKSVIKALEPGVKYVQNQQ